MLVRQMKVRVIGFDFIALKKSVCFHKEIEKFLYIY